MSLPQADHRLPFEYFWQSLKFVHNNVDESDLFLRTSTFTGTAPFMRKEQRQRYINQAFYRDRRFEPLFSIPHGTTDALYLCPKCASEELHEKGYYYLHRAHQLPGVVMCHKHGCALSKIEDRYLNLSPNKMPVHTPIRLNEPKISFQFAQFSKDFMDRGFDCCQDEILSIILEQKTPETAQEMIKSGYNAVSDNIENFFNSQLRSSNYITPSAALAALMHLYGDVSTVENALKAKGDSDVFLKQIRKDGYSLISKYRNDIVTLKHNNCGRTFCTTPYGYLIGWTCPECGKSLTLQDKYKELIQNIGSGEYVPLGDFTSMNKKITLNLDYS